MPVSISNLEREKHRFTDKNVSNHDFDSSLCHATSCFKVNEEMGQEIVYAKKVENTLQALGMSVIVQFQRVGVGSGT